ncbi:LytR/AlgR family response regulator transcription factor [Mucilaginibacter sp. OK098]|uniref:LytR/AlgR family response regulator transcription factor n=1 Tax=Mucilaginibacter sp. OK098 TaxID=1855297 RepID=UPI00091079B8|nr:LytTR family DNA-binding domain-containing protein [Mucilaginibacter sp. OK098]SHM58313.1 two component transcriptional regulator, LytTR family [Mucilaginibacter sp. OK098]
MIRCLAVDDEAYATKIIADYISKVPYLTLLGTTTSAIEALTRVQGGEIDLIFLDIQMPDLTGIQFLKLYGGKCKVILTTAYPEYALDGFEHDVVDYLLKPIAFDRFLKAAQKAFNLINLVKEQVAIPAPVVNTTIAVNNQTDYMFIKGESKNKFLKVDYNDILYIEGLKNYVSVFTSAQRIVTYQSLRDLETTLPKPPFYRVHKSYIISVDKIRMVDGNTVYIGDQSIPIGETYRDGFLGMIREAE